MTAAGLALAARARLRRAAWWWLPLGIFVAFRVIDAVFVLLLAPGQPGIVHGEITAYVLKDTPAGPSYLQAMTNCDGQWYETIAEQGYPRYLPRDAFGHVQMNPWAFYPLFPALSRILMLVGMNFALAASILSMACAALAMVVLFRMVRSASNSWVATLVVLALNAFGAAPIFQAAYTEGIALLLIVLCLWLLRERHYHWLIVAGFALSMARPVVAALALVVVLHWLLRWKQDRAGFSWRERVWCALAAVSIGLSFFVWIAIAGYVTGEPDAYHLTQNAWAGWQWYTDAVPWDSWMMRALHLHTDGLLALALLAFTAWRMWRPSAAAYGTELRLWAPIYLLYLFGSTRVTPSVWRYDMLAMIPLWPAPVVGNFRQKRWWLLLAVVAALGLVWQWQWIDRNLLIHTGNVLCP